MSEAAASAATKKEKVLVMGGLGFIGSHLSRYLLQEGYQVRIFDKLYGSHHLVEDIKDRVEIEEGDAERQEDTLRALQDIDIAVDLIHTTVPGVSMQDPVYDVQTNVSAHVAWLSQLNKTRLKKIVYISSGGTVYGIPQHNPIHENHPTDPISSYGITKLAIEKYTSMYARMHGIDYIICRPANIYGEGQRLHIGQGVVGVFLDQSIKGKTIEIWGDGKVSRDYLYISDMVRAVVKLMHYRGEHHIFNISNGRGFSLNEIVTIMRRELNIPQVVKYLPSRKFDVRVNILDNSRIRHETGWSPQIDLADGISRVYNHLRSI